MIHTLLRSTKGHAWSRLLIIAMLATLIATCGRPAATPATSNEPAAAGTPKSGGRLTMSLADSDVQNFDPIVPTDNMSIWTMLQIYDQILRVGKDGKSMEPGLAEKYEVSADSKTYTFTMRQGVKFHDGTPLTVEDLKFAIERATGEKSSWKIFPKISSMTTPDDKTLVVQLAEPWAPFLADLGLYAVSVIPKKLYEQQGEKFFEKPIGTGPFVFESWAKGSKIVLKKNSSYWQSPFPYLDEVDFQVLPDDNSRMLKFQGGELDIATNVPFNQIAALKKDTKVDMQTDTVARIDMIVLNEQHPPFDDKNVRLALNLAVDKEAIIKSVLFGYGKVATTQLPPMLYWSEKVPAHAYDVAKAKELLAKSAVPNGFKTTLTIAAGDAVGRATATIVQDQLKQVGVELSILEVDPAALYQTQQEGRFDMITGYYTTDIIDPDELTAFGMAPAGGTSAFYTFYKNAEVDTLALEAARTMDPAKRAAMYEQMQQITHDDAITLLLYYPSSRTAVKSYVKDFKILPTANYRLWEVWLDK